MEQAKSWLVLRDPALRTLKALHLACCHAIGGVIVTSDQSLHATAGQLKIASRLLA
jgi:predicted nucleic acid-binding protein